LEITRVAQAIINRVGQRTASPDLWSPDSEAQPEQPPGGTPANSGGGNPAGGGQPAPPEDTPEEAPPAE